MFKNVFLILFILTIPAGTCPNSIIPWQPGRITSVITDQDTLQKMQVLYKGKLWINKYHRIKEDQFLFSNLFLPGSVYVGTRTFKSLRIKYDIYSDELVTPVTGGEILQLNKEMIDSFTLSFENKLFRFTNVRNDTLTGMKGYIAVLYNAKTSLFVKFKKNILPAPSPQYDGFFSQINLIWFKKDTIVSLIKRPGDLFKVLHEDKMQIQNFISKNKLKVSNRNPESYVPVIKFYDSLSH
jgi:hypothetical protein